MTDTFCIPKTMANWPWQRAINPHYEEVSAQSNAWLKSLKPFSEKSQFAFDKCATGLLAALGYPYASKEHLRTGCDFMNFIFVFDEYTDFADADAVRKMVDIVIDAIRNPEMPRPEGEVLLGEIARQFWERGIKACTVTTRKHFEEALIACVNSFYNQALDRETNRIHTVETYFEMRRDNIGMRPASIVGIMGIDIPDEAFYHPAVVELHYLIADLIILDNDICSYNREQATGDDQCNVITIVINQFGFTIDEAMKWAADQHKEVETRFLDGMKQLPSFGPDVDPQLQQFIQAIAMWPRSNDCWSFESGRYFGSKGLEVQKVRIVPIMPKVVGAHCTGNPGRENVVVQLVEML